MCGAKELLDSIKNEQKQIDEISSKEQLELMKNMLLSQLAVFQRTASKRLFQQACREIARKTYSQKDA